jgi:hypothetical protein
VTARDPSRAEPIEADIELTALEAEIAILKIAMEINRGRRRFRRRLHNYVRDYGFADMPPLKRLEHLVAALTEPE